MPNPYIHSLIHFVPNIRFEPAAATTGYTWGKPAVASNIVQGLEPLGYTLAKLDIETDSIVAERWLVSDDRALGSQVVDPNTGNTGMAFYELLEQYGAEILGEAHFKEYGPYMCCIMKQLDTHDQPSKGSLSVQVHPKPGHPSRPAKPEMWQGTGKIYLGWKRDVTEEEVRTAYEAGTLETLLNALELTPEKLVRVQGGTIHAIRYNTFTAEWSMAPDADDIKKGNLKDATVSPYDRTDGKTPRPGKEDLDGTLELLSQYEDGLRGVTESELLTQPVLIHSDEKGNKITSLFKTPEVWVNQYELSSDLAVDTTVRGFALFIKSGLVEVWHQGQKIDTLKAGQEVFVPATLGQLIFKALQPTVMQQWYKPLAHEK